MNFFGFSGHIEVSFTLYWHLLNVQKHCLKKTMCIPSLQILYCKTNVNSYMNFQQVVSFFVLLAEGLASVLMTAEGQGNCGNFLKHDSSEVAASVDSSFHKQFLCSCLIAFHLQNFFQNWSPSSQTLLLFYPDFT